MSTIQETTITSLEEARDFVDTIAKDLDPTSTFIKDIYHLIDTVCDIHKLEFELDKNGGNKIGTRGKFFAGDDVWQRLTLSEKLLANLVTNETSGRRFSNNDKQALYEYFVDLPEGSKAVSALSAPCSKGQEAYWLASLLYDTLPNTDIIVDGYDISSGCISTAKKGKYPTKNFLGHATLQIDSDIKKIVTFEVKNILVSPIEKKYTLISCRNFLGYLAEEQARKLLDTLCKSLLHPGAIQLDTFAVDNKFLWISDYLLSKGLIRSTGSTLYIHK